MPLPCPFVDFLEDYQIKPPSDVEHTASLEDGEIILNLPHVV